MHTARDFELFQSEILNFIITTSFMYILKKNLLFFFPNFMHVNLFLKSLLNICPLTAHKTTHLCNQFTNYFIFLVLGYVCVQYK